jgi:hypothetical protein
MCDPANSGTARPDDVPQQTAIRIAEQVAALLREARAANFDFLAYLLGMVLKEARRLADEASEDQNPRTSG